MKKCDNFPIYYSNEKYKNYLFNLLDEISDKEKEIFQNKGYIIVIGTTDELSKITKIKQINGLFSHYEKYILLYIDEYSNKQQFESTFYHEWGHFVDYCNCYLSSTMNFMKIFYKEKRHFSDSVKFLYYNRLDFYLRLNPHVSMYELTSASEYFAVNYSRYKRKALNNQCLIDIYKKTESSA